MPTPPPPPNPTTGDETPADLDRVRVMRYRPDPPANDVHAILLLIPGFLGGANSFDSVARRVVAASGGTVEVWAIDRRSNFLEDLIGMQAAEQSGNPDMAVGYYFGGASIAGRTFAGFPVQEDLGHVSEWGLSTFVADLRAVVESIPAVSRSTNLFIGGHSLGGSLAQIYSAWDLAGTAASSELAGVVLLDGSVSGEGITRAEYHAGTGAVGFATPGVDEIRDGTGDRTSTLPFIGTDLLASLEILGMRAFFDPYGISCDENVDDFLSILYGIRPWATHTAILGFMVDEAFAPIAITAMRVGDGAGGPFEQQEFDVGGLSLAYRAPTDQAAVYYWLDHESIDPPDLACIRTSARIQFAGPTNFAEWYFPNRLSLDVAAVGDLAVSGAGDDYRWDEEDLRVTRAADMDAPVLAVAAGSGVATDAAAYEAYRTAIAATTRDGATREEDAGFRVLVLADYWHLDPVVAETEEPAASIAAFLEANREGTVNVEGIE